jgi:release factor glutamine methyltransferase
MTTRGSLVAEAAAELAAVGFGEPRRHARRLVASALAISQSDLFGHPERAPDGPQIHRVRMMLGRMVEGEPLSRILDRREFWGLEFILSIATLDPRPETETLVEAVLERRLGRRGPLSFLDLGTGTGCLLVALLREFPAAIGVGLDIAEGAVRTADRNAAAHGCADRAFFFVSDWAAALSRRFDVIVANPPYIARAALPQLPREVVCHDPLRALDGGEDGLEAYRRIAEELPTLLAPGGIFVVELGIGQASKVAEIIEANGLTVDGIEKDLAGIARCLIASADASVIGGEKMVGLRRGPV